MAEDRDVGAGQHSTGRPCSVTWAVGALQSMTRSRWSSRT